MGESCLTEAQLLNMEAQEEGKQRPWHIYSKQEEQNGRKCFVSHALEFFFKFENVCL